MAHIIPSAAKKQITSYPRERIPDKYWDPIGTVLPDPHTFCIDENGISDPLVTNFTVFNGAIGTDNTITTDLPRGKRIRLLNVGNGDEADQRVDFFLANQGCEDVTYSVYVTGKIESFNPDEFEIISGRINGELVDWGGYTISENQLEVGENDLRTHAVPAGTFHIASKFGNRNEWGCDVTNNGITWDVNVPAGPCVVTQITFHAANSDDEHNDISVDPGVPPVATWVNAYYDLTIERQ